MKLKLDEHGNVVLVEKDGHKLPVYIHDDGKEVPFDAVGTVATITRLNGEAKNNRERYEAAETKLKAFDGITDPAAALKAIETLKKIDDKTLVDAGKVDEVKAAAIKATQDQFAAKETSYTNEITRLKDETSKLQRQFADEKIGGSFSRSPYISEKFAIPADMVQARFGQHFKIEDGKIVAYDHANNKIFSRARPGDIADFDEALETLVSAYPYKDQILKGEVKPGGGANNGNAGAGGGKAMKRAAFESLSPVDQMKHVEGGGTITD